ncbi:MlaD family protein [Parvularcula dongshanensis]|uniref:Phospholipid/cholesterol/gamma-HCH transport system substrate-binding protein n=1 Tax=Parvularcula dongshanensis TaxID=1173995 RepID=A0A840I095_9PROT|nr:MlaD family protein [Parvularcula dongshanensis]MBB4657765.1 phospholipid/cholesterol/gamma-HCH transport system substrate-binding protein [Parvularcula dongshanensis]
METKAHYVLIGSFMLGSIILAVLFTLWLGSVEREFDEYDVIYNERISGLQVGAAVQINGIPVGAVSDLRLAPNDPSRVIARIRVEEGTPIKTNTVGELELAGVTGLAIIQLVGGTAEAPLVKDVTRRRVPEIKGEPGGVAAAINSAGDIFANVGRVLSEDNAATLTRILDDVEAVTDVLADNESQIQQMVQDLSITVAIVRRNAEALDGAGEDVSLLLSDTRDLLNGETRQAISEIRGTANSVNLLVGDLQEMVDDNRPAIDAFAQQGLGSAVGVIARTSRLVDTAEGILLEIDRDPTRFLLGEGRPTTAD